MLIDKTYLLAEAVVSLYIFEVAESSGTEDMTTVIYPHINGRERGFNIRTCGGRLPASGISCFVYEHRNTDSICVTISDVVEWTHITETDYKNTKHFGHDVQKAVEYILQHVFVETVESDLYC